MGVAVDESDDLRAGGSSLRTCVVTRAQLPPAELIRFVADPEGAIVPDLACRLPGRGVWVSCDRQSVSTAAGTRAFARSLKREVRAGPELGDTVAALMMRRVCNALSLANKAGLVLTGFAKIDKAIAVGSPIALLHGADAAADGVDKLDWRFAAMCRDAGREQIIVRELAIEQLSLALGRANVVHAALMAGGAAQLFLAEAGRLKRFSTGRPSDT